VPSKLIRSVDLIRPRSLIFRPTTLPFFILYILNIFACIFVEEAQRELFLILFPVLFVIQLFFVLLSQWSIDFQCYANYTKVIII
jgi:putative effector of murein hydrolase